MWSHDVVGTSVLLAGDLKLGQYLKVYIVSIGNVGGGAHRLDKIPPRAMFLSQLWGTIIGMFPDNNFTVIFGSLMVSVARGFCELWCVPWGALLEFQADGLVLT